MWIVSDGKRTPACFGDRVLRRTAIVTVALLAAGGATAFAATATDEMIRCAALGPKRPGTLADRQMGDRVIERFRAAGLETSAEEFHMPVWKPSKVSLTAGGEKIPAETFAYSGTGAIKGVGIVDAGNGSAAELAQAGAKGKVVLVNNSATYHRTVQVENVMAAGGIAMVYVSASPKNLIQTGAVRWAQRPPSPIPALTLGSDTGAALRAKMDAGPVTVDIDVAGERVDAVTRNVIGIRRGTTYPDRYIVVAGHYDSWWSGANDNCTAVGTLLSTVEANKDVAPAYTMIYIGWGAEETGLVGSYTWIRKHQDLIPKVVANVNLEETATATFSGGAPTALPSPTVTVGSSAPLMQALASAAAASNVVAPPIVLPMSAYRAASGGIIATDIEGFYAQGVQGFSTASSSPYYHTTGDTDDKINLSDLERATAYITQVTRTIQSVPPEGLTLREVPTVKVSAPKTAAPGAAVPVDITVTGVDGRPIAGDRVLVLAGQNDNWAVAETPARDLGGGKYRWTLPAGATDAGITDIRATTSTTSYLANGFAKVDQRAGGLLPSTGAKTACLSRRVITLRVRGSRRPKVSTSAGKASVRRRTGGYTIRLDLRGVTKGSVRVVVRSGKRKQTRTFRTCQRAGSSTSS
jgi:aminopeptidase YwaD